MGPRTRELPVITVVIVVIALSVLINCGGGSAMPTNPSGATDPPAPTLSSMSITPANPEIQIGDGQQFTAVGSYSDGTSKAVSGVTWSSSSAATATIDGTGHVTSLAKGTTTIKAVLGSMNASTNLKVVAKITALTVTPADLGIPVGAQQQFTAVATLADHTTENLTDVTWTSINTSIATVDNKGLATAVAKGTTTIQATSGAVGGSTTLTVNPEVTDVLTYHNDVARTGQNLNERTLTPANVNVSTFGKLFTLVVDGKVDAQPLYASNVTISGQGVHNVLYVATENDSVYAFDADNGSLLWQVAVVRAGETASDDHNCGQVTPTIGVTSTPVIDRSTGPNGTIYLVAMTVDTSGAYMHRIHALDLATGAEEFGGPGDIQATYPGNGNGSINGTVVFDPKYYKERAALLLLNGVVYTSWTSHCDGVPSTAWIIAYDEHTLQKASTLNTEPNGQLGTFWNSGGGPAADADGNIYLLAGNGIFDQPDSTGFPANGDYGNAFIKLSTTNNNLRVADYFNTYNAVQESNDDLDLASGAPLILPDLVDSQGVVRHLALGAGKDVNVYLVDRDNMGKYNPNHDGIYQELIGALQGAGEYGMAAYFNSTIYIGAVGHPLEAFPIVNALLLPSPSSEGPNTFSYPGTTPSISADGSNNAIVWAAENGTAAVLHAYDASDLSRELYNSNQEVSGRDLFGVGNKFIVPTVANGKVYVGTTNGVGVFGLLPKKSGEKATPKAHAQ